MNNLHQNPNTFISYSKIYLVKYERYHIHFQFVFAFTFLLVFPLFMGQMLNSLEHNGSDFC